MTNNIELAKRCVLTWFNLTPEMAHDWFTEDAVYESRSDQGVSVKGPDEIYTILDMYRNMVDHFETKLLNVAEDGNIVLLERDEKTYLKNGKSVTVPVMSSMLMRNGKIAIWRDYWDLAILMKHMLDGTSGQQATDTWEHYQDDVNKRGATVKPIDY